jgi:hypothetical protein
VDSVRPCPSAPMGISRQQRISVPHQDMACQARAKATESMEMLWELHNRVRHLELASLPLLTTKVW